MYYSKEISIIFALIKNFAVHHVKLAVTNYINFYINYDYSATKCTFTNFTTKYPNKNYKSLIKLNINKTHINSQWATIDSIGQNSFEK